MTEWIFPKVIEIEHVANERSIVSRLDRRSWINPLDARVVRVTVLIAGTPEGSARQDINVFWTMFHEERTREVDGIHPSGSVILRCVEPNRSGNRERDYEKDPLRLRSVSSRAKCQCGRPED